MVQATGFEIDTYFLSLMNLNVLGGKKRIRHQKLSFKLGRMLLILIDQLEVKKNCQYYSMKKLLLFVGILLIIGSCGKTEEPGFSHTDANLLFSSGFEASSYLCDSVSCDSIGDFKITNWPGYKFIKGTDSVTGHSWPPNILGSKFGGIHTVNDDGGAAISCEFQTVTGHTGTPTTALFQRINYNSGTTQAPYQINNISQNPNELYISFWMKIDDTSLKANYDWRVPFEYKTYGYDSGKGFRLIAYFEVDGGNGKERTRFAGDTFPNSTPQTWSISNSNIIPPKEAWFKNEFYIKWGDQNTGRAWWKIDGEIVADHKGITTWYEDDLAYLFIHQIYGSNVPMHQWVDDIQIWDGDPNSN